MAKAVGIIGNMTGKLGNMVAYLVRNSNNKQTQGFRAYQPIVKNPKSYGQAAQRMRMTPINNIYRALKSIIDRGFEGFEYGNAARLEFLRRAMKDFNGPFVPKGTTTPVPGKFQISAGSLIPISILGFKENGQVSTFTTDIVMNYGIQYVFPETAGDIFKQMINRNTDIQEGDQITIVYAIEYEGLYAWRTLSFVIDTTSTETGIGLSGGNVYGNDDITLSVDVIATSGEGSNARNTYGVQYYHRASSGVGNEKLAAMAVIQSREGNTGRNLRSDAFIGLSTGVINKYLTSEAYNAAVVTYMDGGTAADWPEEITRAVTDTTMLLSQEAVAVTLTDDILAKWGGSTKANQFFAGKQVLGFVNKYGTTGVYMNDGNLYAIDGTFMVEGEEDLTIGDFSSKPIAIDTATPPTLEK